MNNTHDDDLWDKGPLGLLNKHGWLVVPLNIILWTALITAGVYYGCIGVFLVMVIVACLYYIAVFFSMP